ncbi:MAG: phosphate propanoyltransferase [Paenibacillaceae bacterium]
MTIITETQLRSMLGRGVPNPFPLMEGERLTPAARDFLKDRNISVQQMAGNQSLSRKSVANSQGHSRMTIPAGVSNRHVHLSPEHVSILFGEGFSLTSLRFLTQPGQFACNETLTLLGPSGSIENVRILGPARGLTQVEVSITDGYKLGVHPKVRLSGDIQGTPGITLVGPAGMVKLTEGLIAARNHVHMAPSDASRFRVKNGETLILRTMGERSVIYQNVAVRVSDRFMLDFHLDTDEGNAAAVKTGDLFEVIGRNQSFFTNRLGR